jgi:hypothetical protein
MSALEKLIEAFSTKDYSVLNNDDLLELVIRRMIHAETAKKIAGGFLL